MRAMCSYGYPLFSLKDNSTLDNSSLELIDRLRRFRDSYEPYHGYLCTVICSFGIMTNLINVVVLTKRQMRTSINVLLTGIAFCDMGTMASYLIYIIHFVLSEHDCNPFLYTYGWMCFLMGHAMLSIALHTTTLWLSVAMAFIRNMTLRQTRVGSPWLRSNNTWKICVVIYSCVFALSVSSVFSNGIMPWPEYFNVTCPEYSEDKGYKAYTIDVPPENCVISTVTFWLTGTLFKIIPCILLSVLIFSLLCTIKRAEKNRKALLDVNRNRAISLTTGLYSNQRQMADPRGTSDRTTIMLLIILGLSLLTELPQGAVSILSGIYVVHMQEYVYPNVADMLDLLSLINSSVNFILYCIMSSKYRQAFWQVVLPRRLYIRWFIRPRQSARCRTRNRRRRAASIAHRENSRFQSEAILEEEPGAEATTNDYCSSNRYSQLYTCTVDQSQGRRRPSQGIPASSSYFHMRSLLVPKHSKNHLRIPTEPSATSLTSLPSISRLSTVSANMDSKTFRGLNYLSPWMSRNKCTERRVSINDQVAQSEQKSRLFPLRLFQRRRVNRAGEHSWLVGCSCLCKCAIREDVDSTTVEDTHGTLATVENDQSQAMCQVAKIHVIGADEN